MDSVFSDFDLAALPEEERAAALTIERAVRDLQFLATEFEATFELFKFLSGLDTRHKHDSDWTLMIARNGAMIAYGFWMTTQLINSQKAPTIQARMDVSARREGSRRFSAAFPNISAVRIAAAHPGELANEGNHNLKNDVRTEDVFIVSGAFVGAILTQKNGTLTFQTTVKGELVGYQLGQENVETLRQVAALYQEAFYPLESERAAMARRAMAGLRRNTGD